MDHHKLLLNSARYARRPGGFTLLEAVISLAILSIILMVASQVSISLSAITAEETDEVQVQTDVRRAITEITFLLEESKPVAMWREDQWATELPHIPKSITPSGATTYDANGSGDLLDRGLSFTFSTPLKTTDGRPLIKKYVAGVNEDQFGATAYGSGDMGNGTEFRLTPGSRLNTYTVFFQANGEVYDEAAEGVDIDSNNLTTDYFVYGGLFVSNDATQEIRQITGRIAVKRFLGTAMAAAHPVYNPRNGDAARDFDGRGKIFYLESEKLTKDDNDNGVYDKDIVTDDADGWSDDVQNNRWDVKMFIRFYFPITRDDPRRGKVTRLRAVSARVNYFRNTQDKDPY